MDAISHPAILEIGRTVETVLLWPSSEGDEGRYFLSFFILLSLVIN